MKSALVSFIAVLFLAAFASLWGWIAYELWQFTPSQAEPVLRLNDKIVDVAGFLAATVGAGTAAFLGIEIPKPRNNQSFRDYVSAKTGRAAVLAGAVLTYLVVGSVIFAVWLFNSHPTPDFIATFSWGILGWAGGAFTAASQREE